MVDAGSQRTAAIHQFRSRPLSIRSQVCNSDGVWNESPAGLIFVGSPFLSDPLVLCPWYHALRRALSWASSSTRVPDEHSRRRKIDGSSPRAHQELSQEVSDRSRAERKHSRRGFR